MAINKKLITFVSKSTFTGANGINGKTSPINGYYGNIPSTSVVFILDTGEIWTHGKYISGGVWGTKQTGYVPLTISNTTYNLSTSDHTHSQYLTAHQDITGKVNKSGDTMTGQLTLANGQNNGIRFANGTTIQTAGTSDGGPVMLNGYFRFSTGSSWDYSTWAGLGYDTTNKIIYLGIPGDGTIFQKNSAVNTGGTLQLVNVSSLKLDGNKGNSYTVYHSGNLSSLKNPYSLTITNNSGTTENTDKWTYDGSAAKTINLGTNAFSSTSYLPLSAGSSNTLTGYLYLGNDVNSTSQALIFCGSVGTTTGSYFHYNSSQGGLFINGYKYLTLETSNASYHPRVRLGGSDYPLLSTYNWSSYITALKNPNSLSWTDSSGTSQSYDGSAAKTLTINYAGGAGYATYANKLYINDVNSQSVWRWYGQNGQPSWLWGSNDGTNMYVWNPSNFSVNYANSAGSATSATNATYATYVKDYNSTSNGTIQIGYSGTGLTSSTITHVAGYTDSGKKIKDISKSELYTWLGITDTTYSAATSSALGLIKIGYSTSGQNYPVQLDSSNKAYVYVPWTNTDTNTWRGIQNNLTSTSTTDSLSAYQGYLLANGSARDSTKLSTSGGEVTGNVQIVTDTSTSALEVYGGSISRPSLQVFSGDTTNGGYASVSICSKGDGSCWWSIGSQSSIDSGALLLSWKGSSAARAQIQTDGSVKATTFYNSSGTEVSYSGHTHSGIPSGTVGSTVRGVYLNSGSITEMTYALNANINSGTKNALAYYSGVNTISNYNSTVGTEMKPIYLYLGQPTQCSGYMVNNFAVYKLTFGSSSVTTSKQAGSYNFISSVSKESNSGRYIMTCSFPTGYTKYTTMIFGNVSVYNPSNYSTPGHLTIQKEYGTTNGIRLILADDDTPNGYTNSIAYINFITF